MGVLRLLDQAALSEIIYVSATPGPYEYEQTDTVIQQIIRPTGLLDPVIEVRPIMGQIDDLVGEINERVEKDQRVFVPVGRMICWITVSVCSYSYGPGVAET